ncbi:hypothetical protein [Budvicia aquatica]|uniref:Uncharacterized protein n=1 Tax=Budvicia aquatica TaxID=82979 RepID=A0A2C6DII7_9GAMM|nr:hypothetical protein [Budvicia aquatica]PHI31026.1 hypothetical protein CRN84_17645 [Budvicia aquatica]VFS51191.1 Uncharacterised protein [Budvicia aquatica]
MSSLDPRATQHALDEAHDCASANHAMLLTVLDILIGESDDPDALKKVVLDKFKKNQIKPGSNKFKSSFTDRPK